MCAWHRKRKRGHGPGTKSVKLPRCEQQPAVVREPSLSLLPGAFVPLLAEHKVWFHSLPAGLQVAACFVLGASGVALGTRLVATHESLYKEAKKQLIVQTGSQASDQPATLRTTLYSELNKDVRWPSGITGRAITNDFTGQWAGQTPLQVTASKFLQPSVQIGVISCQFFSELCSQLYSEFCGALRASGPGLLRHTVIFSLSCNELASWPLRLLSFGRALIP